MVFFLFGVLMCAAGIIRVLLLIRERPRAQWVRFVWIQSILLLIAGLIAMSALLVSSSRSYVVITVGIIFVVNAGMSIVIRNQQA
jgi:uncharacterized membrane protein HdeD (DUF308 family)